MILAALSLIVGNVTGIVQKNIKRMLAYSAISKMGFVLAGPARRRGRRQGDGMRAGAYSSAMFYSIIYLRDDSSATFGVVMLLARRRLRSRNDRRLQGPEPAQPAVRVRHDDQDVLARRHPADGRFLRRSSPCCEATMNAGLDLARRCSP